MERQCQLVGKTLAQLSLHLLMNLDTTLQQHMGSFLLSSIFSSSPIKWIIQNQTKCSLIFWSSWKKAFFPSDTHHTPFTCQIYITAFVQRDETGYTLIRFSYPSWSAIGFSLYLHCEVLPIMVLPMLRPFEEIKPEMHFPHNHSCVSYLIFVTGTTGARGEKSVMWRIF